MFCVVLFFSLTVLGARTESMTPQTRLELTELATGQYFLNKAATTWNEGMNYCALEGGHMAVVNTVEQADAVKSLLVTYKVSSVHVGFHDQFVPSQYIGIDGTQVAPEVWAPGFPTNDVANNCGGFNKDGAMDIDCSKTQGTICQLRSASSFFAIGSHGFYDFHVERRLWNDAWEVCHGEGGHLWVVDSTSEAQEVADAFQQVTDVWVGVHRLAGDDAFVNILGKPLNATGFSRWEAGFPFGTSESRPYVALKRNTGTPTLWTNTPTNGLPFVCERPAV